MEEFTGKSNTSGSYEIYSYRKLHHSVVQMTHVTTDIEILVETQKSEELIVMLKAFQLTLFH